MSTSYLTGANGILLPVSGSTTTKILGTTAAEILSGAAVNDLLYGNGLDTLVGGSGDDSYNITDYRQKIVEQAGGGIDTAIATSNYTLPANVENLVIKFNLMGIGNSLNNIITGGDGANFIDGKGGDDILIGGLDPDYFVLGSGYGHDLITDFVNGEDRIQLRGLGITSFAQVQALLRQAGPDVTLITPTGEEMVFANHQVSDFTVHDFMLGVDTSRLTPTFTDDFNTLSLDTGVQSGTWRTMFGGNPIQGRTLSNNGEKEIYVDADYTGTGTTLVGVNPFSLNNGVLTITANPASAAVSAKIGGYQYTSGQINTRFHFTQQYGYFEVRAKLPAGNGLWPAFWLVPATGAWPPEIDIFEQLGKDPTSIYQTAHTLQTGSHTYDTLSTQVDNPDQFHTYGLLWDKDNLVWTVDGVETNRQATPADMNQPMYMILNLAVGGGWPGNPDATTPWPAQMAIDYVHVYSLNGTSTTFTTNAPVANNDTYAVTPDTMFKANSSHGVLINDFDSYGYDLTQILMSKPAHGVVNLLQGGAFNYTPNSGYTGTDSFTYKAYDGSLDSNIATVTLNVGVTGGGAVAPVGVADAYTAAGNTPLTVVAGAGVLANDTDANGDVLSAVLASGPAHGTLSLNANGGFVYTPTTGYSGADSFTYQASDGALLSGVTTVNLTVTAPVNSPPVATVPSTTYTAVEQTSLNLKGTGLAIADPDAGSGSMTVTLSVIQGVLNATAGNSGVGLSGAGTTALTVTGTLAQINAFLAAGGTSTLAYINPGDGPPPSTDITLTVNDNGNTGGGALSDSAFTTINITPVNDAPTAVITTATYAAVEQTSLNLKGTGLSVGDVDSGISSVTVTLSVGQGVLSATAGNSGAFVGGSGTSTLTLSGTTTQINALLAAGGTGTLTYLNPLDAPSASTGLSLTIHDNGNTGGTDLSAVASATITIAGVNDAPLAVADTATTTAGKALAIQASTLLANDSDPDGDPLTLTAVTMGATPHGTVSLAGGVVTYTPTAGYTGADAFTYTLSDGHVTSTGTVNLTVTAASGGGSTYTTGTTGDDVIDRSAFANTQLVNGGDGNDTITGGSGADTLNGANGNDVIKAGPGVDSITGGAGNDVYIFTAPDFATGASFDTITDFQGAGNGAAGGDVLQLSGFSAGAVLVHISDSGSSHTYDVVDGAFHGRLVLVYGGNALMQAGDYVFVNTPVTNTAPTAFNDAAALTEDNAITVSAAQGVLANDTDAEGDVLTAVLIAGPAHGTLSLAPDGGFVYIPDPDWYGADSFTYQASDGALSSAPATVALTVAPVNDAPAAVITTAYAAVEQTVLNLTATGLAIADVDAAAGSMTVTLSVGQGVLSATAGTSGAVVSGSGTTDLTLTGTLGQINALLTGAGAATLGYLFTGNAPPPSTTLTLTVHDNGNTGGGDLSDTAATTIAIQALNDPLTVVDDALTVTAGSSAAISAATLLANDSDPDGDIMTVTAVAMGATPHGTVSLAGGVVTYTPTAGYTGADSFTYTVDDGHVTATGTVNVTVNAAGSTYTPGTIGNDVIDRSAFSNPQLVNGNDGNDTITGGRGDDTLNGANGNDIVRGGAGIDSLTGGAGADTFVFGAGDSPLFATGAYDTIVDFKHAQLDKIDLHLIDANTTLANDQAFTFLGTGAFTHVAGQLDYTVVSGTAWLAGDVNGDGVADFQIKVQGASSLVAGDFIL